MSLDSGSSFALPSRSMGKTLASVFAWVLTWAFLPVFCLALEPQETQAKRPWSLPTDAEILALITERMRYNGVGLVVGVIDSEGSRVVVNGRSASPHNRPLDGDTLFQIGSVTKAVTTLLLADMVVRGEVNLHDHAAGYLPQGVTMPQKGKPITLEDLATHMSGLPSMPENFDLTGQPNPYTAYTVEQLHQFLSGYTPERAPGVARAYSNLGVALLGRLLAGHLNTDYEELVTERVLRPLEMTSTSITLTSHQRRRLAPGHDTYLMPVATWEMKVLPASGSLRSTVNDLLKLVAAYLGYSESPLARAMTLQLNRKPLALGWGIRPDGTVRHSGGKQGYRSGVAFNRATGIGAVVLANARTYDRPMDLARHLVTGSPLPPAPAAPKPKKVITLSPAILDRYAGNYRLDSKRTLEVARNGSQLLVRYPNNAILAFLATGQADFFFNTGNDEITFVLDEQGRVTGLTLYGDGKEAGEGSFAPRLGD